MAEKESGLAKSVINESDWIPGTQKPEKDYERVLAYNGKGYFFIAYVATATKRFSPSEKERIWQKDEFRGSFGTSEHYVKFYLPITKLCETLPEK